MKKRICLQSIICLVVFILCAGMVFVASGSSIGEQSMTIMTIDQMMSMAKEQLTMMVDKRLMDRMMLNNDQLMTMMTDTMMMSMMVTIKEQAMSMMTE